MVWIYKSTEPSSLTTTSSLKLRQKWRLKHGAEIVKNQGNKEVHV